VGLQVVYSSITRLVSGDLTPPNPIAGWAALVSAILLYATYRYNSQLAARISSSGLRAVSKDNLSDSLTSIVTGLAIFTARFGLTWLDGFMALVVGLIIIKTGYDVFRESAFSLS